MEDGKTLLDWPIGNRLIYQRKEYIEKLEEELKNSNIILTNSEKKRLVGKKDTTKEFIAVIKILKDNGIQVDKIRKRGTINDLIDAQDEKIKSKINKENIIEQLEDKANIEVEDGKTLLDWRIGKRLEYQKEDKNLERFKNELNESKIFFTEKELKKLTEKKTKSQDIGKATYDAPVEECDKAQEVLDNLVEKTKEGGISKNE